MKEPGRARMDAEWIFENRTYGTRMSVASSGDCSGAKNESPRAWLICKSHGGGTVVALLQQAEEGWLSGDMSDDVGNEVVSFGVGFAGHVVAVEPLDRVHADGGEGHWGEIAHYVVAE